MSRHEAIHCAACGHRVGYWEVRDTPRGLIRHWFLTSSAVPNNQETEFTCRVCPESATASMKARTVNANEATGGVL